MSPDGGNYLQALIEQVRLDGRTTTHLLSQHPLVDNLDVAGLERRGPTYTPRPYAKHLAVLASRRRAGYRGEELKAAAAAGDDDKIAELESDLALQPSRVSMRRWSIRELLEADRTFRWTVKGVLVHPTYGMVGGEQKTLKSYVSTMLDLAIASGTPFLGHFDVGDPQPVVSYVGEGGRIPFTRRVERIAHSMGIELADTELHPYFDIVPVDSDRFTATLRSDLRDLRPALVHIDPWYAFHGVDSEAKNLHLEGSLLSSISAPCIDAGASLLINHHFNKTGTAKGISRLTLAGSQEWVDSWMLLSHRVDPDVANGRFWLNLEIGSRQWGGSSWELDLNVGRFDVDSGEYDGVITWDLRRGHTTTTASATNDGRQTIVDTVDQHPGELSKEDLAKATGMRLADARGLVDQLARDHTINARLIDHRQTDGRTRKVWRFYPATDSEEPHGAMF